MLFIIIIRSYMVKWSACMQWDLTRVSCTHLEIVLARQLTSQEGQRPGLLETFYLLTVYYTCVGVGYS